jgi:hypothetical protein
VPISFTIYPIGQLVRYSVQGIPTEAEAREFLNAVLANPRFKRGYAFLGESDGTSRLGYAVYPDGLAREVYARARVIGPCKWAVVVSSQTGFSLVRVCAARTSACGVEVVPFLTTAEATDWLAPTADHHALGAGT